MKKRRKLSKGKIGLIGTSAVAVGSIIGVVVNKKGFTKKAVETVAKTIDYTKDIGPGAIQNITVEVKGIGMAAKEIAEKSGILCKGTNSPNVQLINTVARKIGAVTSGIVEKTQETVKNGGSGMKIFTVPLFDVNSSKKIIEYIKKNAEPLGNGFFKLYGKVFRIQN